MQSEVIGKSASAHVDPLLTPEQVAHRLSVSKSWVKEHSNNKQPRLPVIRLGAGYGKRATLRYRASDIERFIEEQLHSSSNKQRRYNGGTPAIDFTHEEGA